MTQLTKGMYGGEFHPTSKLFGLICGQVSGSYTKITHNSGWYNKHGEKIGWGDLASENFERIARELDDSELFVALGEADSHWNFVDWDKSIKRVFLPNLTEESPGITYVAKHALYVILRNQLYFVDHYGRPGEETRIHHGLSLKRLESKDVRKLMRSLSQTRTA